MTASPWQQRRSELGLDSYCFELITDEVLRSQPRTEQKMQIIKASARRRDGSPLLGVTELCAVFARPQMGQLPLCGRRIRCLIRVHRNRPIVTAASYRRDGLRHVFNDVVCDVS